MSLSGRFVLRIPPSLHRRLRDEADKRGLSLNEMCRRLLAAAAGERGVGAKVAARLEGVGLVGVVLFGSRARGDAGDASDTDLLLVLPVGVEPTRDLYRLWDERTPAEERDMEPHFAALPARAEDAGSLWLEAALNGVVLWESDGAVSRRLAEVRDLVARGRVRRHFSHGHPYWVWEEGEER